MRMSTVGRTPSLCVCFGTSNPSPGHGNWTTEATDLGRFRGAERVTDFGRHSAVRTLAATVRAGLVPLRPASRVCGGGLSVAPTRGVLRTRPDGGEDDRGS